jgi:hypothetical protein
MFWEQEVAEPIGGGFNASKANQKWLNREIVAPKFAPQITSGLTRPVERKRGLSHINPSEYSQIQNNGNGLSALLCRGATEGDFGCR